MIKKKCLFIIIHLLFIYLFFLLVVIFNSFVSLFVTIKEKKKKTFISLFVCLFQTEGSRDEHKPVQYENTQKIQTKQKHNNQPGVSKYNDC